MSSNLAGQILAPEKRTQVVDDCVRLIDEQVAQKGGISGIAIKGAYKIVKAIKPGFVRKVADGLLDEFVEKLESRYAAYQLSPPAGQTFGQTLATESNTIADELLGVTDQKAATSDNGTVVKLYKKLRPTAQDHVGQAVPALGQLLDKHLAA